MVKNKYSMLKVKDKAETYYTKKNIIFDLPFRLLLIGKSQFSGKSSTIFNFLLRDEFYLKEFEGDNIFIVSASLTTDNKLKKLIEVKDIPNTNLFSEYNEMALDELYDILQEDYEEAINNKDKPTNKLLIFDDISFKGDLKKSQNGVVSKLFCNGRHINVSTILTAQKYTDINTTCRENATGCVLFSCSNKQLDIIADDHNKLNSKKQFMNMFRDVTKEPYSFMVVNYTNPYDELYLDKDFNKINYSKY